MKRIGKYTQLDDDGVVVEDFSMEFPDDTPVEVPLRMKRPLTLEERMRQFIRSERVQQAALEAGLESFEDADDFEVEDPEDDFTPHELAALMEDPNFHRHYGNPDVKKPAPKDNPPQGEAPKGPEAPAGAAPAVAPATVQNP